MSKPIDSHLQGETLTARDWARALHDNILLGQHCQNCGYRTATAVAACVECGSRDFDVVELPTEGEVHSETLIKVSPPDFDAPYTVAIVQLDEGVRVTAQIDTVVNIGDSVSLQGVVDANNSPAPLLG